LASCPVASLVELATGAGASWSWSSCRT